GGKRGPALNRRRGCDRLVHDGECITHRAIAGFGKQRERGVVGDDVLGLGDELQLADDVVELYGMEAEVLAARADGLRYVFGLRCGHHEDDVVGRFFERLEQRVEGRIGDLMGLVEDVDLVLVARWTIARRVAELPDFVDAAVGGGVDFDDVDRIALTDFEAGLAVIARFGGRTLLGPYRRPAVQCRGKDAGNRRFADTAVAGKNVPVGDTVLRQRVE